jgi:hypothetical protein
MRDIAKIVMPPDPSLRSGWSSWGTKISLKKFVTDVRRSLLRKTALYLKESSKKNAVLRRRYECVFL